MLMKIAHHNDGKEKSQSHTCYLFNDADRYHNFDLTNIYGYGETKEEALEDYKKKFGYVMDELRAFERMLFETDVLENSMVEVDVGGNEIK